MYILLVSVFMKIVSHFVYMYIYAFIFFLFKILFIKFICVSGVTLILSLMQSSGVTLLCMNTQHLICKLSCQQI